MADAKLTAIVADIEKILTATKVYTSHPDALDAKQRGALIIDAGTLARNADRLVAALGGAPLAAPKAATPAPSDDSILPLLPVDLSGHSTDTATYLQQLFAIEAGQPTSGVWPSEATVPKWRAWQLIQLTGSILSSGPAYHKDPLLTVAQVVYAANLEDQHENELNLNPVLIETFNRAKELTATADAGAIPWAGQDATVKVVDAGDYGKVAVSGWYGTGEGPQPA